MYSRSMRTGVPPDPDRVASREDFARELRNLRDYSGHTIRALAALVDVPFSTLGGYLSGKHLPTQSAADQVRKLVEVCGGDPATQELWLRALQRARQAPTQRVDHGQIPYRGLATFQEDDAEWFCGRDALVTALLEQIATQHETGRIVPLVAPSGAGKSSLLRAGLIPAVRRGDLAIPASERWPVHLFTPGRHPLEELARHFDIYATSGAEPIVESLVREPQRYAEMLHRTGPTILVVDQFEELFSLCEDRAEQSAFVHALHAAAERSDDVPPAAVVVIGLRADLYAEALRYPQLAEALQGQVLLRPMDESELRQAIVEPAAMSGVRVADDLVERLLREMAPSRAEDSAAHEAGALPLLSHTLLATWTASTDAELSLDDYAGTGGILDAIARTADSVYDPLTTSQRAFARRLFVQLVHLGEDGLNTRQPVRRTDLVPESDPLAQSYAEVIDRFVQRRLITADVDTVQISHEALLRAWPRLRRWLTEDREDAVLRQRLVHAAELWDREGRDPAILYRGTQLSAVLGHLNETGGGRHPLPPLAREFVRSSDRRERRRTARLWWTIIALSVLVALVVSIGVVALRQREAAVVQQLAAQNERNLALSRMVAVRADRLRESDTSLAAQLSLVAYQIAQTPEARASVLDSSASYSATRILDSTGIIQSIAVDPRQKLIASGGADEVIRLWDISDPAHPVAAGRPLTGPADTVFSVAFSPDGRFLAAGAGDGKVYLWKVEVTGKPTPVGQPLAIPKQTVYSVAFSPDGSILAAGSSDKTVHLWRISSGQPPAVLGSLTGATGAIQSIAFDPAGTTLAGGTNDAQVLLWKIGEPGHPALRGKPLAEATAAIQTVSFSPDGKLLAAGSVDRNIYLWRVPDDGGPAARFGEPLAAATSWINGVRFSPDSSTLAASSSDSMVRIWDLESRQVRATLPHPGPVTSALFGSGGRSLITASGDGVIRLWGDLDTVLSGFAGTVNVLSFAPDNKTLAVASTDTQLWDVVTHRPQGPGLTDPAGLASAVAVAPDGRVMAVGGRKGGLQVWNISNRSRPVLLSTSATAHGDFVESVSYSPDGTLLATASDDKTVRIWNSADPSRPVATLKDFTNFAYSVAFSPNGRLLAAASVDETVRLWDISNPRAPVRLGKPLTGSNNYMLSVAFSPDGRTLAAGSADKSVRMWNVDDPAHPRLLGAPLSGAAGRAYAIAFSPNGTRLAVAHTDGTLWLWDVTDKSRPSVLATLNAAQDGLYTVAFSPDGRTIAAGGAAKSVWLWQVDPDAVSKQVCDVAGAPITRKEWAQYVPGLPYSPVCA